MSMSDVLPTEDTKSVCSDEDALGDITGGLRVIDESSFSDVSDRGCADPSTFTAVDYFRLLVDNDVSSSTGPLVLFTTAETASTQSSLQRRAGLLEDWTVFVADKQRGGRGRGGNVWTSPDGCLMFSMSTKYPGNGLTLPFVQYAVSLAVVQAIEAISGNALRGFIKIKWPNDIYFKREDTFLKIGGILCHSAFKHGGFYMTIGVGLNVDNSQPTTCLNDLMRSCGANASFTREALVAGIVRRVQTMLPALANRGFTDYKAAYYQAWLHTGQIVRVQDSGDPRDVRIVGLAENGYLLASDDVNMYELSPDGNSFDFLQGLIAKKM